MIGGAKAGMWFDHETGQGGGFVDLVGRELGLSRRDAHDWIADRIGMGSRHGPVSRRNSTPTPVANVPIAPRAQSRPEGKPGKISDDAEPALSPDSLFHMKPEAIATVGLLVIDEAFWQSGLRGLDGKATLTQDGLEPGRTSLACYDGKGKTDVSVARSSVTIWPLHDGV